MAVSWRSPNARFVDVALFVGVTLVLSVVVSADQAGSRPPDVVAYLWAVGLGALMLVRRTMPRLVLGLTALGFFTYYLAGFPAIGVAVPISAALFSAAEAGYVRASVLTGAAVLAVSTAFRVASGQSASFVLGYELAGHVALIVAVIALGYSVRARRDIQRRSEQVVRLVARQTAMETTAHTREQQLRLARELHDSIGHSLSVASLFTDVAREVDGTDDTTRATALQRVKTAVSDAMAQLRSTVALLRSTGGEPPPQHPTLGDLHRLLEAPAAAGYDVTLTVDELSASREVEACVYRVVQESVTNTMRHSDASRIEVAVHGEEETVEVTVHDNGTGTRLPRSAPGHGLRGMRERVEQLSGSFDVHPGPAGWRVRARLPAKADDEPSPT
ncbi:sensor histidine kinase [Plantactinospora mayteni]|uniref:histidine kinase n=1 Tax=Plantactinospora mayteni TaxID=566021 RepID=A0ABQ4F1C1_9ACTN|nr:sensor histidine kinase [Plantactinospora mayteni]GIH00716.1 two-component sensor histidine kinase [Plantactinospora mayteni]